MWWQILPSVGIITAALAVPVVTIKLSCYVFYGCTEGRELDTKFKRYRFFRDQHLYGRPIYGQHQILGLDMIPDN